MQYPVTTTSIQRLSVLIICLLLGLVPLSAQLGNADSVGTTFHYKLLVEAPIYPCNILGVKTDTNVHAAPAEAVFSKIGTTGNFVIIRFWNWKDVDKNQTERQLYNFADSSQTQRQYFLLPKTDFQTKAVPRYNQGPFFSMGTIVIPVKIRTSPFDFSTDVTLGPAAGVRFLLSPYSDDNYFNILMGFGVTHVTLDSLSTMGTINQSDNSRPALTLSLGGVFEFSNAQIGFFVGWDYVSQNSVLNWRYQGKPWLSVGLGYSIISRTQSSKPANEGLNGGG